MNYTTNKKFVVIKDRIEVYKDFTLNLLYCIYKYYVDRESLSEDEDIHNHFLWCFNRVNDSFKKEELDFSDNEELKQYFYNYYYHQFYLLDEDKFGHNDSIKYFEEFWNEIFTVNKQKNKNILSVMIELYAIFDKSVNKEKNILEFV